MSTFHDIIGLHTPTIEKLDEATWRGGVGMLSPLQSLILKAVIAASTSGLGGVPLYFVGELPPHVMGFCIIFAAGLMTGCSVVLFMEGLEHCNIMYAMIYTLLGAMLIHVIGYFITDTQDFHFVGLKGANASKALLIILSMSLHSLGEGISVGVSAQSEHESIGLLVVISLAIHNIPEGIATSLLLMSRGMNVWTASLFSVICNLPQPLMAIPSFLFMETFEHLLPFGFCLASGAMTYIVCSELIPESSEKLSRSLLISTFSTSLGIIVAIAVCAKHV
ncbi:hypothetical protein RFI_06858 [Reticulomyxa filosa]|uniref:Zinc/iron permease n=1 Tax=Reticulomyxa filosa TaxID=46433 RepID=X6NW95_RETFI|nr:hypothetical protein RFI_06858 [Reticulomyxa filosa]|eukprot:ETO30261.1 hypothetical protein RFI_06858 [Reticulomyxa filosa]